MKYLYFEFEINSGNKIPLQRIYTHIHMKRPIQMVDEWNFFTIYIRYINHFLFKSFRNQTEVHFVDINFMRYNSKRILKGKMREREKKNKRCKESNCSNVHVLLI